MSTRLDLEQRLRRAESFGVPAVTVHANPCASGDARAKGVQLKAIRQRLDAMGVPGGLRDSTLEIARPRANAGLGFVGVVGRARAPERPPRVAMSTTLPFPTLADRPGTIRVRFGTIDLTPARCLVECSSTFAILEISADQLTLVIGALEEPETVLDVSRREPPDDALAGAEVREAGPAAAALVRRARPDIETQLRRARVEHLIIATSASAQGLVENALGGQLSSMVVDRIPSPAKSETKRACALWEAAAGTRKAVRRAAEHAALARARDHGVRGLHSCLEAVEQRRVSTLIMPWSPAGADEDAYGMTDPGRGGSGLLLRQVLPAMAGVSGAELRFVREEAADQLCDEMGGVAAVVRW